AHMLKREDGRIDWSRSCEEIDRQIRGLTPWPGAFTMLNGVILKIGAATPRPEIEGPVAGSALDDALTIVCGTGALRIDRIQKPGRSMMDAADFVRGQAIPAGTRFD
ncbi:MAG: methionyl-tRNA formyltransferase, partial [Gluconobacter sp.]